MPVGERSVELHRLPGELGQVVLAPVEGELPGLNIGTDGGATCAAPLEAAITDEAAQSGISHVVNGRFRGGWTTRHYGRPTEGVHAIQLELADRTYLDEPDSVSPETWPPAFDPTRAAPLQAVLRRMLGGNRPQCALVAVAGDAAAAIELAERLQRTNWPNSVAVQITLDFGPVLAPNGTANEERLKDLDTGGGPLEAPESLLLASATFAAEARLVLGETLSTVALGRVARLDTQTSAVQLLPSTEIYAVSRKG